MSLLYIGHYLSPLCSLPSPPCRFQHALTQCKYALKCAVLHHLSSLKNTDQDVAFVASFIRQPPPTPYGKAVMCMIFLFTFLHRKTGCPFQESEHYKRMARRCFHYIKPQKIRWLEHGQLQVKTSGSTWIGCSIQAFKQLVIGQLDIAEEAFTALGIPLINPDEFESVRDADMVPVAHGLWTLNPSLRHRVGSSKTPQEILQADTVIGVALGLAACYTGGGAMRVPEVLAISVAKVSGGSTRRLA